MVTAFLFSKLWINFDALCFNKHSTVSTCPHETEWVRAVSPFESCKSTLTPGSDNNTSIASTSLFLAKTVRGEHPSLLTVLIASPVFLSN